MKKQNTKTTRFIVSDVFTLDSTRNVWSVESNKNENYFFAKGMNFGKSASLLKKDTQRVRSLIKSTWAIREDIEVMVTEVECNQIDCVPIETLVILIDLTDSKSRWTGKILMPIKEVCPSDVEGLNIPTEWRSSALSSSYNEILESLRASFAEFTVPMQLEALEAISKLKSQPFSVSIPTYKQTVSEIIVPLPPPTIVPMKSNNAPPAAPSAIINSVSSYQLPKDSSDNERHVKGVRQRGCPCCDPDNIDNIVDKLLFATPY